MPVILENGKPAFGAWREFKSGVEAARAGQQMVSAHRGVVVIASLTYQPQEENFFEPISVLGDVPEELLGELV